MVKRLTVTCLWVPRSLQQRCRSVVAYSRVGGTECNITCMKSFEAGCHYLHYLHHSLAWGQNTGREHSPTHSQKTELKIYWAWLCPSEQDPVFPTASPSHQEAWISLLSSSIRGKTEWKLQSQKTNQNDHMDHSSVTLTEIMSLLCRQPKRDR